MGPESADVLQMVGNAGTVVKLVLLLLLIFSITSWAIIFIKYRYIRRAHRESTVFIDTFWESRNLSEAFSRAKQLGASPVARMFRAGYMELKALEKKAASGEKPQTAGLSGDFSGIENVKRSLRRSIRTEVANLSQLVPFLATAGNTAPFIGLFGTVWGIMTSFQGIAQSGSANLAVVAPGISEALVVTAAGLAVAIPSVIAYNYFVQRLRMITAELEGFSADFLNIVERDILRGKGGR